MRTHLSNSVRRRRSPSGLAMVEVVVSTVIVAVAAMAAMSAVAAATDLRERAVDRVRAQALADHLLAEVIRYQYCAEPDTYLDAIGRSSAESSAGRWGAFNDMDDFNAWSMTPPADASGTAYAGFEGCTASFAVRFLNESTFALVSGRDAASATRLKRVIVTIRRGGRTLATAAAVRSWGSDQYGGLD